MTAIMWRSMPTRTAIFFNQKVLIMCAPSAMIDPSMDLARSLNHSGLMTDEIIETLQSFEGGLEEKVELLIQKISETEEGRAFLQSYQESRAKSLYPLYADAPKGARSQALIEYGTRELCLELDCIYGLKESHHISDFSTFFQQTGLTANLLEPDAAKADSAIVELTQFRLETSTPASSAPPTCLSPTPRKAPVGVSASSVSPSCPRS